MDRTLLRVAVLLLLMIALAFLLTDFVAVQELYYNQTRWYLVTNSISELKPPYVVGAPPRGTLRAVISSRIATIKISTVTIISGIKATDRILLTVTA